MSYHFILSFFLIGSIAQAAPDYSLCAPQLAEVISQYVDLTKPNVDIINNPAGVLTEDGQKFGTWEEPKVVTGYRKTARTLNIFERVPTEPVDQKLQREITFYMSESNPNNIAAISISFKDANAGWPLALERADNIQYTFLYADNKCVLQRVHNKHYDPTRYAAVYRSSPQWVSYDLQTCREMEQLKQDMGWSNSGPCWSSTSPAEDFQLPAICNDSNLRSRIADILGSDYNAWKTLGDRISPDFYKGILGTRITSLAGAVLHSCQQRNHHVQAQALGNAGASFRRFYNLQQPVQTRASR